MMPVGEFGQTATIPYNEQPASVLTHSYADGKGGALWGYSIGAQYHHSIASSQVGVVLDAQWNDMLLQKDAMEALRQDMADMGGADADISCNTPDYHIIPLQIGLRYTLPLTRHAWYVEALTGMSIATASDINCYISSATTKQNLTCDFDRTLSYAFSLSGGVIFLRSHMQLALHLRMMGDHDAKGQVVVPNQPNTEFTYGHYKPVYIGLTWGLNFGSVGN